MAIENINVKQYHVEDLDSGSKILTVEEHNENICELAEKIFVDENSLGKGKTAEVFTVPGVTNVCCKKLGGELKAINSFDEEAEFLEFARDIDDDSVIIPTPIATIEVQKKKKMKNLQGKTVVANVKEHAFLMKEIDGFSIEDILERRVKDPQSFLEGFDIDKFFSVLDSFIKKMHKSKHRVHHRDLHGGNIMINRTDFKPVVIDFGHAVSAYGEDSDIYNAEVFELDYNGINRRVSRILPNDLLKIKQVKSQLLEEMERLTNI
jgi:serine/threonine protein kinase